MRWAFKALMVAHLSACVGCAGERQIRVLPPNQLVVSRIVPSSVTAKAPGCAVETLNRPSEKHARELGTIQLAGKLPSEAYIFALINHKACEMGANAIMIKHLEEQRGAGGIDYQATVAAFANDESAIPPESFASTPSPQTQPTHIESGGPVETQPAQVGDTPAPGEPHATSPSGLEPNVESPAVSAR